MTDALRATARQLRAAMPCSVELPAGTGKTQLVAALATVAAECGERALILTHTNAGVDALRRRLKGFGVPPGVARVDTIASWSFALARHYPVLSGVCVGEVPQWSRSAEYYLGAAAAADASAIGRMLQASYDFSVVDEYQDCVVEQNTLVLMLNKILPVCVLGDPLQNIFSFGKNLTVKWGADVLPNWPNVEIETEPWRWKGHNEPLGRWLLDIRDDLYAGRPIDFAAAPVTWKHATHPQVSVHACLDLAGVDGSVVAIGPRENSCAKIASRTSGAFSMMEELEGKFMLKFASVVDGGRPEEVAIHTLQFAKNCNVGVADKLDSYVAKTLERGKTVSHLKREGAEEPLRLLSRLLTDPSPAAVRAALLAMRRLPGVRPYRREAWRDMLQALAMVEAGSELNVVEALTKTRNMTRRTGRVPERRVISRPLLIKGLEYDHAVVLNAEQYSATELYVALTRGRKSVTVVSASRRLQPAAPAP